MTRRYFVVFGAAALALVGVFVTFAGPLDPPAGAVSSTYKTLAEIEPRTAVSATNTPGDGDSLFKITQPGSYYVTGNITGVAGKHGIEITSGWVTLDLNGFDLAGAAGSLDGVSSTLAGLTNVTVRNGSVRGWGGDGIDLASSAVSGATIIEVVAFSNASNGIRIGSGGTIARCSANFNGGDGIFAASFSTISETTSGSNVTGIQGSHACTLSQCTAHNNTGDGFLLSTGSTITGCSGYNNGGSGFETELACVFTACSAYENTQHGISATDTVVITDCCARSNTLNGIEVSFGGTITGCTSRFNLGNGFSLGSGSIISDCSAQSNTLDGIRVTGECKIRGNRCDSNGVGDGAGIHVTFADNVIEGNTCTRADRGIDVDVAGNVVVRNTCSGNTLNWSIVANNVCGPILDRTSPGSAAINGNVGADSTASTHPNANFTY